eukprot:TRINITY_DN41979_c0_g1_i2.p1 TRINITY_DN41979_c0_g1~~TRINITY_DN41979_c0_g1_i2.p1  ORF type:complete len:129 (+),score=30.28 TRINITY_DN41979_c0_g1_i2:73-459(+)
MTPWKYAAGAVSLCAAGGCAVAKLVSARRKRQAAAAAALAQEAAVAAMIEAERQAQARRLLPIDDSDYSSDDEGSAGYPDTPRPMPPGSAHQPAPREPQLPPYKSLLWWGAVGTVLIASGARDSALRH